MQAELDRVKEELAKEKKKLPKEKANRDCLPYELQYAQQAVNDHNVKIQETRTLNLLQVRNTTTTISVTTKMLIIGSKRMNTSTKKPLMNRFRASLETQG